MQADALRLFVELAEAGSFYKAAKRTYMSHQGLNKAISALESDIGVKLVERTARGVRLTTQGDIFLDYARGAIAGWDAMLDEIYAEERIASGAAPLVVHLTYYASQISSPIIEGMGVADAVRIVEEGFQQLCTRAKASDGSDLFIADAYGDAPERLAHEQGLVFEPVLATQLGVVWKDGSPLAGRRVIHREQLADLPLAVDSHREMMRMVSEVMQDYPLNNIRLGVAEPRSTIGYAEKSSRRASTLDSFGFVLACENPSIPTDELNFTPLSTPRSICEVGLVYSRDARPNVRARRAAERLKSYLHERYPDYYESHPVT